MDKNVILYAVTVALALWVLLPPYIYRRLVGTIIQKSSWRFILPFLVGYLLDRFTPLPAIAGSLVYAFWNIRRSSLTALANALRLSEPAKALGKEWEQFYNTLAVGKWNNFCELKIRESPLYGAVLIILSTTHDPTVVHIIRQVIGELSLALETAKTTLATLYWARVGIPLVASIMWTAFLGTVQVEIDPTLLLVYQLACIGIFILTSELAQRIIPADI
ncbi:hypothetical protein [Thermogutta sp.]|uniref:hypothetical protein n=1 Tax=Thermogutta sp. TaxID=1962930 RepID=UPI0032205CED